ncbi:NAD-dependent epimerase/dehydratase family protein [bacterium]|nr:NAD-dependent epimerase/dehydratase family protein [candidate division CSSED10-310 bacterium]
MKNILVTGANGQIGSELVDKLETMSGLENIVASDVNPPAKFSAAFENVDVTNKEQLQKTIEKYGIDTIFHLASILSVKGEENSDQAWNINMNGLKNVLDLAREFNIKIFWPSSIAVFGPNTPKNNTPQDTILDPYTMYGITKLSGEFLCHYYFIKFGIDVRSVRYPGIISNKTKPGGGTTDYAVDIFYGAVSKNEYTCFVGPKTRLPMMYMPDAIRAAIEIMKVDESKVPIHTSYNLAAISPSVEEIAFEIQKKIPDFNCYYDPDFRQRIADSWPQVIDDSRARTDWNWKHDYDLPSIVDDMLEKLAQKYHRIR